MYVIKWTTAALYAAYTTLYYSGVNSTSPAKGNIDSTLYEAFDNILGRVKSDLLTESGKLLKSCHVQEPESTAPCRTPLDSEPQEAGALLPFLLDDETTMTLWKNHFVRHAKELYEKGDSERESHTVFWNSRPAASHGAYQYLLSKMEKHRQDKGTSVTWEAHVSPRFQHVSIHDVKAMMGVKSLQPGELGAGQKSSILPVRTFGANFGADILPDAFDARDAFPFCKDVIGQVRDQGRCGSCWAVAATSTLNDRACIASQGKIKIEFSAQHTTSCCDDKLCYSYGCDGGMPDYAWQWFVSGGGVVSGGEYGELKKHPGDTCWPMEAPNDRNTERSNPVGDGTPKCRTACLDKKYKVAFKDDKHPAKDAYVVEGDFKHGLMEGPLTTTLIVYEDFLMYKGGVYEHIVGEKLGGHAVRMIGWGKEGAKPYWLAVNSWNTSWGDQGLFKIKDGDSEFGHLTVAGTVSSDDKADEVEDHDTDITLEL